jgi:hypothetical protein
VRSDLQGGRLLFASQLWANGTLFMTTVRARDFPGWWRDVSRAGLSHSQDAVRQQNGGSVVRLADPFQNNQQRAMV